MKIKLEKFGFESMNFAIPVQCSTNRANMIFIYSLHRFITNKLPIGLLAQCRPEFFFNYCLSSVHYCADRFHIHFLIRNLLIWLSYIHSHWFITSRVYYEANIITAPSGLARSVGRALHWCRRGHGFKSRIGLSKIVETYSVV